MDYKSDRRSSDSPITLWVKDSGFHVATVTRSLPVLWSHLLLAFSCPLSFTYSGLLLLKHSSYVPTAGPLPYLLQLPDRPFSGHPCCWHPNLLHISLKKNLPFSKPVPTTQFRKLTPYSKPAPLLKCSPPFLTAISFSMPPFGFSLLRSFLQRM